jgi:hypothetical protein
MVLVRDKRGLTPCALRLGKIMNSISEETRIRYLYRSLILRGRVKVSLEAARKLVGPDCAYHLYSIVDLKKNGKK